jgi:CRISPR system Cascade subunit CasE
MSLYLSRLCLNPLFGRSLQLAADAEGLHKRLLATVVCHGKTKPKVGNQEKTADMLFRVDASDSGPVVLIQSLSEPDWDALELAPRALSQPAETKKYEPAFFSGQRLSFRLRCRPSKRLPRDPNAEDSSSRRTGPRRDCRDDDARIAWLNRKGAANGFIVESVGLTLFSLDSIKSDKASREPGGSFTAVQFDGVLVVTDPDLVFSAVQSGIGQQKAFGFGLLSLAPLP